MRFARIFQAPLEVDLVESRVVFQPDGNLTSMPTSALLILGFITPWKVICDSGKLGVWVRKKVELQVAAVAGVSNGAIRAAAIIATIAIRNFTGQLWRVDLKMT